MKIHIAHSPDSDDAFMFYGLASGKVPDRRPRARPRAVGHRDAESRGLRRQVRDLGGVVPRLRAPDRQVHPAAARRQHGRQLRPDGRGPQRLVAPKRGGDGWPGLDGVTVAIPGHADDGVSRAAAVQAGRAVRRDAVRRDPRGGARRQGRSGPADSRGPAHLRAGRACASWSTSASGGRSAPTDCRCRLAATSSAATSDRSSSRACRACCTTASPTG